MTNEEIINDFRRRYENTFVQVIASTGTKAVGKVTRVRADPERFANLEIATKEFGNVIMNMGSDEYQIKFDFPKMGVFQFKEHAIYFARKAEKQYQRGLSSGNCSGRLTTASITGGNVSLTVDTVASAFEHKVYSLQSALYMLRKGLAKSVALANNFSICLPMQSDKQHYYVWHWGTLVASLKESGKLVKVFEPVFEKALEEMSNGFD